MSFIQRLWSRVVRFRIQRRSSEVPAKVVAFDRVPNHARTLIRRMADPELSETERVKSRVQALEAARQWRWQIKLDLAMVENEIRKLEAELEQPQGDPYRGQIPAAKVNTS